MLTATHLYKKFDHGSVYAVKDVSFSVYPSETLGILGPNGAGKTTLLRMLAALMTPTDGSISLNGTDIHSDILAFKRQVGYMSNNTRLYSKLTPSEVLQFYGNLLDISTPALANRISYLKDMLELESFFDKSIFQLSTGQTQRVSLARCLLGDPDIYILDEPTLGLDIMSAEHIHDFILHEHQSGKLILYSTHSPDDAYRLCDKVLVLNHGDCIAYDSPDNIIKSTHSHDFRDAIIKLLSSFNSTSEDS